MGLIAASVAAQPLLAIEPLYTIPLNNRLPDGFELLEPQDGKNLPLGSPGSGLSGKPDSVSFDNTTATGMGIGKTTSPNTGRVIVYNGPSENLQSISSFTVCGWLKTDELNGSAARLVTSRTGANQQGFDVVFQFGCLQLYLDGQKLSLGSKFILDGEWAFFAVTADLPNNLARCYSGTSDGEIVLLAETPLDSNTQISQKGARLIIGNVFPGRDRPFKGFLDRIRVFAVESGSEGNLSKSDLEAIRFADLKR